MYSPTHIIFTIALFCSSIGLRKPNVGTATNEEEPTDREANNIEDNVMEEGDSDEESVSDGKHQHIAICDVVKI